MKADAGAYGGVAFGNDKKLEYTFPIRADGEMHTYNIWLGDYYLVPRYPEQIARHPDPASTEFPGRPQKLLVTQSAFRGSVPSLTIVPTYAAGASGAVESIAVADRPSGPPLLVIEHVGPAEAMSRVGGKTAWGIRIGNAGGQQATGMTLGFGAEDGLRVVAGSVRNLPASIPPDETRTAYFDVDPGPTPGSVSLDVTVRCDQGDQARATGRGRTYPAVSVPEGTIPTPSPIVTGYDIGAWYFLGWGWLTHWPSVVPAFERRPELGYYDERDEAAYDWDIKWAVEHGVNYFLVECIWTNGRCQPFMDGLLKAGFLPYIQFEMSYVNHEGAALPGQGEEYARNFLDMIQYWIENYFRNPRVRKTADGRVIVNIFNASLFYNALGKDAERTRRVLAAANDAARHAGLAGISWTGGGIPANQGQVFRQMGFERIGAYNWPEVGTAPYPVRDIKHYFGFAENDLWNRLFAADLGVDLPVGTGFEHRTWRGGRTPRWVVTGLDGSAFEEHLRRAKSLLDERGDKSLVIEAWNEWGEGSALGPYAETGFDLLEALQRVFAPGENSRPVVVPSDVGVYPREIADLWRWVDFMPAVVSPGGGTPPSSGQGVDIPPGSYPGQPAPH